MTVAEYQEHAMRTAKDMGSQKMDMIHAAMGLSSDAGEFVDAVKKHAIYGKELDWNNYVEELGDCLWFIALACHVGHLDMSEVMARNISKLALRYPEKYTDETAIARADKVDEFVVERLDPNWNTADGN